MITIRVLKRIDTITPELLKYVKDYLFALTPDQIWEHKITYRIMWEDESAYTYADFVEIFSDILGFDYAMLDKYLIYSSDEFAEEVEEERMAIFEIVPQSNKIVFPSDWRCRKLYDNKKDLVDGLTPRYEKPAHKFDEEIEKQINALPDDCWYELGAGKYSTYGY